MGLNNKGSDIESGQKKKIKESKKSNEELHFQKYF